MCEPLSWLVQTMGDTAHGMAWQSAPCNCRPRRRSRMFAVSLSDARGINRTLYCIIRSTVSDLHPPTRRRSRIQIVRSRRQGSCTRWLYFRMTHTVLGSAWLLAPVLPRPRRQSGKQCKQRKHPDPLSQCRGKGGANPLGGGPPDDPLPPSPPICLLTPRATPDGA